MADRADREVVLEEVLGDAANVVVGADVLGRSAPGDDQRDVVGWIDLGERDVDRELAAELLGVRVRVRVEVVDHELDVAPCERGNIGDVAGLTEAIDRVHRIELLGGVADQHEHLLLRHASSLHVSADATPVSSVHDGSDRAGTR